MFLGRESDRGRYFEIRETITRKKWSPYKSYIEFRQCEGKQGSLGLSKKIALLSPVRREW